MREETAGGENKRQAERRNGKRRKETAGGEKNGRQGKNDRQGKTAAGEKTAVLMRGSRNKRLEKYHIL